jgi:membrane associated rhomboid family serine protease
MFIPIGDENPTERRPYVNYFLLAANIAAFFLLCLPVPSKAVLARWAMIPADLDPVTLFTSLFLHANLMHLAGNMIFLWIFGDNVEDRLGHVGYAVFYLACGLAADAAHVLSNPGSSIPTLGASGAISGVMGAYVLFFPRHHVKMLLWFGFFIHVVRTPAFLWIGFWFVQQVIFSLVNAGGGVAYGAHIGGFVAGAAVALGAKAFLSSSWPKARIPEEVREASRGADRRRPFISLEDDPGVGWIENPVDRYALLRLSDELSNVGRIAELVSAATGEPPKDVARRIEATRGILAKDIPRVSAERLQRELHVLGQPSALIILDPANDPPPPLVADAVSWDSQSVRVRAGDETAAFPWSAPFLFVAGKVRGQAFMDVFLNRKTAFRFVDAVSVAYAEADPESRAEFDADLARFARSVVQHRRSAALNEGVRVLAHRGDWGWLAFDGVQDYSDYVFWLYNLILSQVPIHRG